MPYPPEHRQRTRERIVRSAQVLFNRHGFDAVSIDQIMAHAGLTRGGFYKYFDKKSDLYAEAVGMALREIPVCRLSGVTVNLAAADAARQVIRAYLSREHQESVDVSCPMVTVPSDVARSDMAVKLVFEKVFKALVDLFSMGLKRNGSPSRQRALVMAGICVGGMVVARSLADSNLADSVRGASSRTARHSSRGRASTSAGPQPRRAGWLATTRPPAALPSMAAQPQTVATDMASTANPQARAELAHMATQPRPPAALMAFTAGAPAMPASASLAMPPQLPAPPAA